MILFAAYTTAETPSAFHWARQPQKLPLPVGGSRPHLIHGPMGSVESARQMASRSVNRLCTAHPFDQHTDRQTMLRVTFVAIGRIYALRASGAANNVNCAFLSLDGS